MLLENGEVRMDPRKVQSLAVKLKAFLRRQRRCFPWERQGSISHWLDTHGVEAQPDRRRVIVEATGRR